MNPAEELLYAIFSNNHERGTMQVEKYIRVPFVVDAVQVTRANLYDVAKWCDGEVLTEKKTGKKFIKVRVERPLNERQTQAFTGDWVLFTAGGFKVYTTQAFERTFEPVFQEAGHLKVQEAKAGEEAQDVTEEEHRQLKIGVSSDQA